MSRYTNKRQMFRTGGGQFSKPPSLTQMGARICPRDGSILMPEHRESLGGFIDPKRHYKPCPLCGWDGDAIVAARPKGCQITTDREGLDWMRPLLSSAAVVCTVYYAHSMGGDGEIPCVLVADFTPPEGSQGFVLVEPSHEHALHLAALLQASQEPPHA